MPYATPIGVLLPDIPVVPALTTKRHRHPSMFGVRFANVHIPKPMTNRLQIIAHNIASSSDSGVVQVINDSKTPSGRVHVGALRGVVLHDAMFRLLIAKGLKTRFLFGVDDYDPLDEIPKGQGEWFASHVGKPLCNVPAPPGSSHTDVAEHFIAEFFDIFAELGVKAEQYRMRDLYRNGSLNESIDRILTKADVVRKVYKDVSGSTKGEHWHPFQTVCEMCGRIGTTEVLAYDGKEVDYVCRPDMVKWAKGCGHQGKVSPFDGRGKLPWKLEWVAKWQTLGITVEGAGKDHNTKGGSRDVAAACFAAIFAKKPPTNIPYEFFLAEGKKMSSSKGVGSWARDMADFLAPEVLRYLILRTPPEQPVDFPLKPCPTSGRTVLDVNFIIKLFNDWDRFEKRFYNDAKLLDDDKEMYRLCEIRQESESFTANFQLLFTYAQMPHVDIFAELTKRKGSPLTEIELEHLNQRVKSVRFWLDNFARDEDLVKVQEILPSSAAKLSVIQRLFLTTLSAAIAEAAWEPDVLHAIVFETAKKLPIKFDEAFQAIYRVIFDRLQGPPAGAILAVLPREFVLARFNEVVQENG